ncbi:hypothetical protein EBZ37_12910 [bacterium]|nr:hypothetical protein [bacterium]
MSRNSAWERKRVQVSTSVPMDSCLILPQSKNPEELLLLLHGFAETGERFLQKILPAIPDTLLSRSAVLAPNAPFLMPVKAESQYLATFSWYFYDPTTDEYFIDMKPAVEFLRNGLKELQFLDLPLRIIGFSQGGFLAPIAATQFSNMKQLIGIGCEYLIDEIPGHPPSNVPYRVDAIHGALDESVSPERAKHSHDRLMSQGVLGSFTLLQGSGHRIDEATRLALRSVLALA